MLLVLLPVSGSSLKKLKAGIYIQLNQRTQLQRHEVFCALLCLHTTDQSNLLRVETIKTLDPATMPPSPRGLGRSLI